MSKEERNYPSANAYYRKKYAQRVWLILGILIVAIVGFALLKPDYVPGPVVGVRDVAEHTDDYIGKSVTVKGVAEEVYGLRAFTIGGELGVGDLLVVGGADLPTMVQDAGISRDAIVQVTGELRRFDDGALDDDLRSSLPNGFDAELVIIAQAVARSDAQ